MRKVIESICKYDFTALKLLFAVSAISLLGILSDAAPSFNSTYAATDNSVTPGAAYYSADDSPLILTQQTFYQIDTDLVNCRMYNDATSKPITRRNL